MPTPDDPAARYLQAAAEELFYRREDPRDPRLGERVGRGPQALAAADVVLLGYPVDEGVARNRGRVGAARAPAEVRRWFYRLTPNRIDNLKLCDLGDLRPAPTLEESHMRQREIVAALLAVGKRVVILGGGNDVSFPDASALAGASPPVAAINVDAHFDFRTDTPCNSGTPYRQLVEGGHLDPRRYTVLGWQPFANAAGYESELRGLGANLVSLGELRGRGLAASLRALLGGPPAQAAALFWGFDLDAVSAADAPGVSAVNPSGLRAAEFCWLARTAGAEPRTRIIEFSETNPAFDVDGRTARLVAVALWHYLAALAQAA
ncbi:MAG: formimidoylglutamase [Gammaproteobacteria bacterium]|nr:formimidoylglutamase [Gammaproteobacteria bacterium]